jgi:hypothetical protein
VTFHVKVSEDTATPYFILRKYSNYSLVSQLVKLLISSRMKVFQPPLTNIVHALLNLPLASSQSIFFPESSPTKIVQLIIDTIDRTIPPDTESIADTSLDEGLSPVFALLSSLYEIAPDIVKDLMKQQLLPTEKYLPRPAHLTIVTETSLWVKVSLSQVIFFVSSPMHLHQLFVKQYYPYNSSLQIHLQQPLSMPLDMVTLLDFSSHITSRSQRLCRTHKQERMSIPLPDNDWKRRVSQI